MLKPKQLEALENERKDLFRERSNLLGEVWSNKVDVKELGSELIEHTTDFDDELLINDSHNIMQKQNYSCKSMMENLVEIKTITDRLEEIKDVLDEHKVLFLKDFLFLLIF